MTVIDQLSPVAMTRSETQARAAWRLETLGLDTVYRYVAGRLDWLAVGLPSEGDFADMPRVGDLVRRDLPSCGLDAPVEAALEQARRGSSEVCLVLMGHGVVLRLVRVNAATGNADQNIADVMEPGPKSYRPYTLPDDAARYMRKRQLASVLVTNPDGQLLGYFGANLPTRRCNSPTIIGSATTPAEHTGMSNGEIRDQPSMTHARPNATSDARPAAVYGFSFVLISDHDSPRREGWGQLPFACTLIGHIAPTTPHVQIGITSLSVRDLPATVRVDGAA